MHALMAELYPNCRSITGEGFRQSLHLLAQTAPIQLHEVASGTEVFDWTVPEEWNIRDAYLLDPDGRKVVDFNTSNLHVMSYSVPVNRRVELEQLRPHLFSLPDQPDLIPYKTSYYARNWGFCLRHRDLERLPEGEYQVVIDSSLNPGSLTYGEIVLPGATTDEVLISCHSCHPSLANDNLSGMALTATLARLMSEQELRYTYRFLFIPGTIGSITWLALNEDLVQRIRHGLVVACVGDPGMMHYKKSRRGDAEIDRVVAHVLKYKGDAYEILDFSPYGYDERQYCSPGFDLPVGSLTRTPHGRFPEYHTSADNLNFVQPEYLADSLETYLEVIQVLEENRIYRNTNPKCEPQLGKRGLYRTMGGHQNTKIAEMAMLWTLNLSDGSHSLLDVAERAALSFETIREAADRLQEAGLLIPD